MTLVELLAAIAIAGLVLLSAILLLNGVMDTSKRVVADADSATSTATARASLRDVLAGAFATFDTLQRFDATDQTVSLSTRCPSPGGWFTPCRATLVVDGGRLRVRLGDGAWEPLARYDHDASLRFYSADRRVWVAAWSSSAVVPDAIGVVMARDTAVYTVGPSRE